MTKYTANLNETDNYDIHGSNYDIHNNHKIQGNIRWKKTYGIQREKFTKRKEQDTGRNQPL